MSSCVTYNKCLTKYGVARDTVRIQVKTPIDTVLVHVVQADTVQGQLTDSLLLQLQSLSLDNNLLNDTISKISESGKLKIRFWYDQYTKALKYKGTKKTDTVYVHYKDTTRSVVTCPPCVVFDKDKDASGLRKLWLGYQLFAAWALLILIAFALYKLFRG